MFDHVTIRATDREASVRFYATVLATLGIEQTHSDEQFPEWDDFAIAAAGDQTPATRRLHVGFVAPSRAAVEAFWRAGTSAGYRDDGAPGPRPAYRADYNGAFLLDPDGNSVEAVHHGAVRRDGGVDHLWIRVADVRASRRFYETVGLHAGFGIRHDGADRVSFAGSSGSFSVVSGTPTRALHLAFGVPANATVDAFHAAAVAEGHRSNGDPGERPVYHEGYYGAFVLDPDGSNVELVNHNRPA